MRRQARRKTIPADPKATFLRALEGGRNETLKNIFGRLLERSDNLRIQDDGRWHFRCRLGEADKGPAYAVANFDGFRHCNALITYDLRSFECWDVAAVIETLRIN